MSEYTTTTTKRKENFHDYSMKYTVVILFDISTCLLFHIWTDKYYLLLLFFTRKHNFTVHTIR